MYVCIYLDLVSTSTFFKEKYELGDMKYGEHCLDHNANSSSKNSLMVSW